MRLFRRHRDVEKVTELREQVESLRQENIRLRLEEQRPVALGDVAERARGLVTPDGHGAEHTDVAAHDQQDAQDAARQALARAEATRASVLDLLQELQVAAAQLERQLSVDATPTEIDRRVTERRHDRTIVL